MQRPAISYYVLTGIFLIDTRVLSFIIWFLKALIAYIVQQVLNHFWDSLNWRHKGTLHIYNLILSHIFHPEISIEGFQLSIIGIKHEIVYTCSFGTWAVAHITQQRVQDTLLPLLIQIDYFTNPQTSSAAKLWFLYISYLIVLNSIGTRH